MSVAAGHDTIAAAFATSGKRATFVSWNENAGCAANSSRKSARMLSSTRSVGMNGYRTVMWAGTPRCADQSCFARQSETSGSASGTSTTRAVSGIGQTVR